MKYLAFYASLVIVLIGLCGIYTADNIYVALLGMAISVLGVMVLYDSIK